jgi:site-specific recombinase XerD
MNYQAARDAFLDSLVRDASTIETYRRGIDLFIAWKPPAMRALGPQHAHILVRFIQWLVKQEYDDGATYSPSSALLYLRAVRRWWDWLGISGYLPDAFPLALALHLFDDALKADMFHVDRQPPEPPDIPQILAYYDTISVPDGVASDAQRRAWILTGFRNRALVRCLADSGGRISEVLSLRVGDFPPAAFDSAVWKVKVLGKRKKEYYLWLSTSLPHVQGYIRARGDGIDGSVPLFVNHLRNAGRRMSRQSAWHVVSSAADELGLGKVSPHDFRHWRATQLRSEGVPLDDVAFILGHRNLQTTRDYYAHVDLGRVAGLLGEAPAAGSR